MKDPIIDKILTEWAYRVHDGSPDPTNPYHMVLLERSMTSMKLPRRFKEALLYRLREEFNAIKKDTGNIASFKTQQNRDAAIKRGTHSEIGDEDSKKEKPTREIPAPEYLDKFSDTASKVMSNGGVAVLETADEIAQSAIDMTAGGIGGPAAFFGESQTTDLINKIGSGREKRSKEDFINDMVNKPPPDGYKGTPIYNKIGEESMRKWLNSAYDGAVDELRDVKDDQDAKYGKQKEPYPIAMTVNDQGMAAARSLIQKKLQEAKTPEEKAHYENELEIWDDLVEKAAYKDGGSDGDADTLMIYTDTDGRTRLRSISNKQTINDIQLNSAATSRSATMESVAPPKVANNMKSVLNEAIDNSSKLNTGFTANIRDDIDEMGVSEIAGEIPDSVVNNLTGRDTFDVNQKYVKNSSKNKLVKQYLKDNPGSTVKEAVLAVVGKTGKGSDRADTVSGNSAPGAPGKYMTKIFETTRDIRNRMNNALRDMKPPPSDPPTDADLIKAAKKAQEDATKKDKKKRKLYGGNIPNTDWVKVYKNKKLVKLEQRHIDRSKWLEKQHEQIVSKTQELDGGDPAGENGPHQRAYVKSFMKEMHWESYVDNLDGRKSINMGGKTYRPSHFRQALAETSGFSTKKTKLLNERDKDGNFTDRAKKYRKELQEHLEKTVKMAPGGGEVYIVSNNPNDPNAVVICTKRDKKGKCLAEVKGHVLATDDWRTAGDGGKVDGSLGKAMKTKLQEVRER